MQFSCVRDVTVQGRQPVLGGFPMIFPSCGAAVSGTNQSTAVPSAPTPEKYLNWHREGSLAFGGIIICLPEK